MEMLLDLYCRINFGMEATGYGKLPRPGVCGSLTVPGHFVLALRPVVEKLEGITAKAWSVMDAEVRQALSDSVSEILAVEKAYDLAFPSEYVLHATSTVEDEQAFGGEAWDLADHYVAAFGAGGKDKATEEEEEEPGSS